MALLSKLKSMLGIGGGSDDPEAETTVTVEHEPDEPAGDDPAAAPEAEPVIEDEPTDDAAEEPEPDADEGSEAEPAVDSDNTDAEPELTADTEPGFDVDDPEPDADADETEPEPEAATDDDSDESAAEDDEGDADEPTDAEADEVEPTDTADDTDEPTDTADDYSDEPLDSIKGIGPAYSERLHAAGVTSIAELAEGDAEEIGEAISVSPKTVSNWIDRAAEK